MVIDVEKAICLHMNIWPARMTEISPKVDEVSVSQDVNLPFEAVQMRKPGQLGQTCKQSVFPASIQIYKPCNLFSLMG